MTRSKLTKICRSCTSFRQLAKRLGTNHHAAKNIVEKAKIDVRHFDIRHRRAALIGEKHNRLTIQKVYRTDRHGRSRWLCRCNCECGSRNIERRLDGVLDGHIVSCGCAFWHRPQIYGANNPAFSGCGELSGSRMYWLTRHATRRDIPFKVTKEYLWRLFEKQSKRCALSGIELVFGRKSRSNETTASLDRIDSTKGYIKGNVQWVHKDVNRIKWQFDQDYFLSLCTRIAQHHGLKLPPVKS